MSARLELIEANRIVDDRIRCDPDSISRNFYPERNGIPDCDGVPDYTFGVCCKGPVWPATGKKE